MEYQDNRHTLQQKVAMPGTIYATQDAVTTDQQTNLAAFDGSFAPSARPLKRAKPWYKDQDYFMEGWTSLNIWKAAVSYSL
jgi:hypothetical protein